MPPSEYKLRTKLSYIVILVAFFATVPLASTSFAQQQELTTEQATIDTTTSIIIPQGAGTQESEPYYLPETAQVPNGAQVTWVNEDSTIHTSTAGSPSEGPTNQFDTGLINPGASASTTITSVAGMTISYYCTLHPWMVAALEIVPSTAGGESAGQIPEGQAIQPFEEQTLPSDNETLATEEQFIVITDFEGETYAINGSSPNRENVTAASFNIIPENNSIEVAFNGSGMVQLVIPDEIIGNVTAVSSEGQNITFSQAETNVENATAIEFAVPDGVETVTITGTNVIPEFGTTLAILILVTAIAVTIAISRRSGHHMPIGKNSL